MAAFFVSGGHHSLGAFVALNAYKDLLSQSLVTAFDLYARYKSHSVHLRQANEIIQQSPMRPAPVDTIQGGQVALRGVTFRYSDFEDPVLRDADLRIEPGEFVVLVGSSGAGKSTVAKLICGMVAPEVGKVTIDGLAATSSRRGLGSLFQSDRLLSASIRDNVTLFRTGVSDEAIYEALKLVEMDTFIRSLPMRLDTYLADSLASISGGQRQRILLARALLGRPRLLILDEATSALDVETERRVLSNLSGTGATIVLVAHRPEARIRADRVYEVRDGLIGVAAAAPENKLVTADAR